MNTITREDFATTTQAKSDQMNAVDLVAGPVAYRITAIRMTGSADQPVAISVDGHKQPWKPSKTFRRVLLLLWPDAEPSDWVGRDVVLWCDPEIKWAAEKVGGIAISHASHIKERKTFLLAESKSKRKTITVDPYRAADHSQAAAEPVELDYYPEDAFEKNLPAWIALIDDGKKTAEQIIGSIEKKAKLTVGQKSRIKASPPPADDQVAEDEPPPMSDDPFA